MNSSCFWYVKYTDGRNVVFAFLDPKNKEEFEYHIRKYYNIDTIAEWYIWSNEKDNI